MINTFQMVFHTPATWVSGGPHPFSVDLSLKWDWGGAKIFDVDTSSTQNNAFPLRLQFWLGRTLYMYERKLGGGVGGGELSNVVTMYSYVPEHVPISLNYINIHIMFGHMDIHVLCGMWYKQNTCLAFLHPDDNPSLQ